jgi:hypothetical protein
MIPLHVFRVRDGMSPPYLVGDASSGPPEFGPANRIPKARLPGGWGARRADQCAWTSRARRFVSRKWLVVAEAVECRALAIVGLVRRDGDLFARGFSGAGRCRQLQRFGIRLPMRLGAACSLPYCCWTPVATK